MGPPLRLRRLRERVALPPPAVPEFLKLRLETSKTSQIRVMGDGKLLFKGRLHSEDPKNFQARDGFEVTSNEPGAMKLQLNGESVPFRRRIRTAWRQRVAQPGRPKSARQLRLRQSARVECARIG